MPIYSSYQNLDLEIEANDKGYHAQVVNSPVGQVDWIPFSLPFSPKERQQARALFGLVRQLRLVTSSEPPLDPKQFGVALYNSVFGGEIGRCLSRSLERMDSESGLRIRLRLNNAPDLADLPWEYLCAPPPFGFFALSARTPIVRYLGTQSAETPLTTTLPLRILAVIANPASRDFPALAVEAEWEKLQSALADLQQRQQVVLERLETATLEALARLRTTAEKEPIHLLHFIGHGGMGVLVFEDQAGKPQEVPAEKLGEILHEHRSLRLVFLNACEGGRSEESDIFMGVAPQLVEKEVPAVIAMKYAVTDRSAINLAARFYEAIADGYPVDAALAEARRGLYTESTSVEWGTPLLFMRSTNSALIDPLDIATIPACPYPGMVPFSAKDARFFFGREDEIAAMRRHLRNQKQLFVIGPSGSGKSSLVFAGLLPALENKEPGKWQVRVLRPGAAPQVAMQEAVGDLISLTPSPARQPQATDAQQLLLVVDQFEELFVQNGKAEQNSFIAQLKAIRQLTGVTLLITMRADFYPDLMNSDFWPVDSSQRMEIAPLRGDALRDAIEEPARVVKVTLESSLVERLLADAADEPGVLPLLQETMILLWDTQKRRVLPLEAYHALGTQRRSGLAVAMATKADATLASLGADQTTVTQERMKTIARRIFLRLVQFGEGRSDTRRQQSLRELRQVATDASQVDETLSALVENRLLTLSGESSDAERKVDIAHEMLIVGWPTSQSWVQSRREAELTRRRLEEKAKEWVRLGKSSSGLLDEAELAEAERWMASADAGDLGYSDELKQLTERSRHEIQKAANEKEAARQSEEEGKRKLAAQTVRTQEQQRRATVLRRFAYGLAVLALVAAVATVVALLQSREANTQRQKAEQQTEIAITKQAEAEVARDDANENADAAAAASAVAKAAQQETERLKDKINADQIAQKALLANIDTSLSQYPQRALLLAIEAVNVVSPPVSSSLTTLHALLGRTGGIGFSGHEDWIFSVAFAPDGKTLASGSKDGTIRLWSLAQPTADPVVLIGHEGSVRSVAFSPDGKMLASGSDDRTIRLWSLDEQMADPIVLSGHAGFVMSVAFAPDGKTLVSGSQDSTIRLWSLDKPNTHPLVLTDHIASVLSVAFSPDGKMLASGSADKSIRLWSLTESTADLSVLISRDIWATSVAFSPDGKMLAVGSGDNTIHLWSLAQPQAELIVLTGHKEDVYSVAFSPDGKMLASGSLDKTIRLWSLAQPQAEPIVLVEHEDIVWSVGFSPDGESLASGSADKTVRLWSLAQPQADRVVLLGPTGPATGVAFTPDGKTLASGSSADTIHLWSLTEPNADPVVLIGHDSYVTSVAFSPDGKMLASGSGDPTIRLWSLAQPTADPVVLIGHEDSVQSVVFSPDGKTLASGSVDKTIRLWSLAQPTADPVVLTGYDFGIFSLAFSPDGKWLASNYNDNTIRLWSLAEPPVDPVILIGHDSYVTSVAFSLDGKMLASGSGDKTIRLWSLVEPKANPVVLTGHMDSVSSVAFSPNGKWLASLSGDKTIRLWSLIEPTADPVVLTGYDSSISGLAFSPDGKWLASGSTNNTILLRLVAPSASSRLACAVAGRNLSIEEWQTAFGESKYRRTCPQWPEGE